VLMQVWSRSLMMRSGSGDVGKGDGARTPVHRVPGATVSI
jgi:hypothetical protein